MLVLGQCSRTIHNRLEAHGNWKAINTSFDLMALLSLICQYLYNWSINRQATHTLIDAEADLHKFWQSNKISNSNYLEKLKGLVDVVKFLGLKVGTNEDPENAPPS